MFQIITFELTNDCQRQCYFCGRAKARAEHKMDIGYMDLKLFRYLISQFQGEIVQFSRDGEPLLHPCIYEIGKLSSPFVTGIVTNGLLLYEKKDEIIDNFTTVTVSVIDEDYKQFEAIKRFNEAKGNKAPMLQIKFLGDYYNAEFEKMGLKTTRRSIHAPLKDTDYKQSKPPLPEIGICLDFMNKPSIDWEGFFYICNRYDPDKLGVIGNCLKESFDEIWYGDKRKEYLEYHKRGVRDMIPMCNQCTFYGIPTS